MTKYRDHSHHLEPLPSDFGRELEVIDTLLAKEAAGRKEVSEETLRRVYEVSVTHLPHRRVVQTPTAASAWRLPQLSRLSMAASVVLAVLVGIVLLRSPGTGELGHGSFAMQGTTSQPTPSAAMQASLSVEQEWLLMDAVQLAHVAEMRHLSLADVNNDLAMLVRELEM